MPLILGTNSIKDTGHDVDNSLRFDKASSAYLNNTPGSDGSTRKLTFSVWFKKADPINTTTWNWLIHNSSDASDGTPSFGVGLKSDNISIIDLDSSGSYDINIITNEKLRDVSAWYHIFVAIDTTQSTNTNRVKVYLNGSQITSFATAVYPDQNHDFTTAPTMDNSATEIGRDNYGGGEAYFDGYMCEMVLLDGTAGDINNFGEFDSDTPTVWKPKKITGQTFGTNGFHLEFKQTGTSANSSGIGADTSGVGRHFAVNNLAATDQSIDTCTNNFATMNPLDNFYFGAAFSEGNLKVVSVSSVESYLTGTIGVSTGKWYWEIKITSSGSGRDFVGIADKVAETNGFSAFSGNSNMVSYYGYTGQYRFGSSGDAYGDTFGTGDIIGVAMDLSNNKLYFSKNGTFQNSGDPTSGSTGTGALAIPSSPASGFYFPQFANIHNTASTFEANFGSPAFSISSGNTDGNGFGNFEYAVPSGYFALCTKNLAESG